MNEFGIEMNFFKDLLISIRVDPSENVTSFQDPIKQKFLKYGWVDQVNYPESDYKADFAKEIENRFIRGS